jgi:integrase
MPQRKTSNKRRGAIRNRDGKLFARLTWMKPDGKRAEREQRVLTKTEGYRLIDDWVRELERHGDKARDRQKMTFSDLADHVRDRHFVEPIERDGRRISGVRTWKDRRQMLEVGREYFGKRLVRSITWGDVEEFRRERLNTPTWRGDERSIARVNRELAVLRRAFNVAKQEGWIDRSPFESGKPLIEVAHENRRERILAPEEEVRLLAECTGRRAHLKAIVICALDTGMRQGEILSLTAGDVNLLERIIRLRSTHTKTQQSRAIPITRRLLVELQQLMVGRESAELVFGIEDNVKKSFTSACRRAGITGLHFHDLRHTAATRWIQAGIPVTTVSRLLGHADIKTTYRYVNPTPQMLADVLAVFDSHAAPHIERNGEQLPSAIQS